MSLKHFIKHLPYTRSLSSAAKPPPPPPSPPPSPPPTYPSPPQDPHALLKHDPIQVLSDLWSRSFSLSPFSNLSGFLSNLSLWVLAFQRSSAHFTGSFPSSHSLSSSTLLSLVSLRDAVLSSRFSFNSPHSAKPFLPNPNRNKPSKKDEIFQDRVVQEMLLLILEPVFEPRFSAKSHAFRPGRNPHSAIRTIRSNFAGYLWFLKGDLSDVFDDVDTDVLMGCVRKGVKDKKVLNLIRMAVNESVEDEAEKVKEGFGRKKKKRKRKKRTVLSENEPKPDPYWLRIFYSFAPEEALKVPSYGCCGILSPLLANILLNELDHMMEGKIVEFFRPNKLDSIWRGSIDDGSHNPSWPEFVPSSGKERTRKMDYIRYGGHILIGIRGPREEAVRIRQELVEFCEMKYGIKLDNSKMQIEHISRGVQFLDHKISLRVIHPTLRYTGTGGEIMSKKGVGTLLSVTASLEQCIRKLRNIELLKGDKDPEPMPCNPMIYSGQAHTNVQMNKFLETMADWYRYADNRKKVVAFFAYVIRSSVAKLYAARYRLNSRAKVYKIATRDLSRPLRRSSNRSVSERSDLLRMGLVEAIEGVTFSQMSMIPSCDYTPFPKNWVPNHERILREYLTLQDPKNFCELQKLVKQEGLSVPQEEITEILWSCKTFGVRSLLSDCEK